LNFICCVDLIVILFSNIIYITISYIYISLNTFLVIIYFFIEFQ
jgi:hypothetical protein